MNEDEKVVYTKNLDKIVLLNLTNVMSSTDINE